MLRSGKKGRLLKVLLTGQQTSQHKKGVWGMNKIMRFIKDEEGLEMVEYAIIGALITVAAIVAITALGTKVSGAFNTLQGKLPTP